MKLQLSDTKLLIRSIFNVHTPGKKSDVFMFSLPRAGSTWLMELIASQPGFKYYDEPLNIRRENVKRTGMFDDWDSTMPGYPDSEKILRYLDDIKANKYKYMNPAPFRKNHRFFTNRIIFKIHEIEHLINDIKNRFDGYMVFLVRHPIANTISRHQLPRLEYFVKSKYFRENYLSKEQSEKANEVFNNGDEFEKGILSWCLQNLIPIKYLDRTDWLFISYEELLLNPIRSCELICDQLDLEDKAGMMELFDVPASNIAISSKDTLKIFQSEEQSSKNVNLVTKWKNRCTKEQEESAFDLLSVFDLDVYKKDRFIPTKAYLNFEDTTL